MERLFQDPVVRYGVYSLFAITIVGLGFLVLRLKAEFKATPEQKAHWRLRMLIAEVNKGDELSTDEKSTLDDAVAVGLVSYHMATRRQKTVRMYYYTAYGKQEELAGRYPTTQSLAAKMAGIDPSQLPAPTAI